MTSRMVNLVIQAATLSDWFYNYPTCRECYSLLMNHKWLMIFRFETLNRNYSCIIINQLFGMHDLKENMIRIHAADVLALEHDCHILSYMDKWSVFGKEYLSTSHVCWIHKWSRYCFVIAFTNFSSWKLPILNIETKPQSSGCLVVSNHYAINTFVVGQRNIHVCITWLSVVMKLCLRKLRKFTISWITFLVLDLL